MGVLVLVALAGFAASLVDGALGMGFGPTSSTILLAAGLTPAAASTTVNIAKVAGGTAAGIAHWRFGNIDRRLVLQLAVPGCLGAAVGVTVLANIDGDRLRPYLAVLLLVVGVRILVRFSRSRASSAPASAVEAAVTESGDVQAPGSTSAAAPTRSGPAGAEGSGSTYDRRYLGLAAFAGGITNGLIGAWGPVVTPVLLSRRGLEPRVAIGSVNTAEIAVALTASGSLLASLGGAGVDAAKVAMMLLGTVLAAPLAAWVVRHLAPQLLGIGAGALLLLTNVRELAGSSDLGLVRWATYAAVATGCIVALRRTRPVAVVQRADAAATAR
jgi:uncharacterized protein